MILLAPIVCILEHTLPWRLPVFLPALGRVRPQVHLVAPLRVGHHRQVAAVDGADARQAARTSVRIHGVHLRGLTIVVDIPQADATVLLESPEQRIIAEGEPALAVRNPDTKCGALHSLQHYRPGLVYFHGAPPALEALGHVVL